MKASFISLMIAFSAPAKAALKGHIRTGDAQNK